MRLGSGFHGPLAWAVPLSGLPFLLFGLYMAAGRFVYTRWKRQGTYYYFTDRQLITLTRGLGPKVTTVSLEKLDPSNLLCQAQPDGSGSIAAMGAGSGLRGAIAFVAVPNVREVRSLIERQLQTHNLSGRSDQAVTAREEDPIAQKTSWTPLQSGGASFRTHKLRQVAPHRMEFRAELGSKAFALAFGGFGLAFIAAILLSHPTLTVAVIGISLSFVFVLLGAWIYYTSVQPIVFDNNLGWYWNGRQPPTGQPALRPGQKAVRLGEVHALQILAEEHESTQGSSGFTSVEMNLVLNDGERVGVVDHGDLYALRADAQTLSAFLGVPVWDDV
jgi:hypothetical protein